MAHMNKVERHDAVLDYVMTNTVDSSSEPPAIKAVEGQLRIWRKASDMKSLDIKRKPPPPMNDDVLDIDFEHKDGRTGEGTVNFTDDELDPTFEFTLSPGWTVDESISPRMRDALFDAHVQLGMIELHVTWT